MSDIIYEVAQAIKNSILNIEAQILAFKDRFLSLQEQFRLHVATDTHLTVLKLHDEFRDHGELPLFVPEFMNH